MQISIAFQRVSRHLPMTVTDRSAIVVLVVIITMSGRHDKDEALLKVMTNT